MYSNPDNYKKGINDEKYYNKKFEMSKFFKLIKINKNIKNSLLVPILSGLTYSSWVLL